MFHKEEKRHTFITLLEAVYYQPDLKLKEETKKELVKIRLELNKNTRIAYLAYQLYPFIYQEKLDHPTSTELTDFSSFLLKNRWRYYAGSVLGMAFANFHG